MQATGILRRVDDLGRVVIPKEIRRTLNIHEGDPMEIFLDNNGGVTFVPYKPLMANKVDDLAQQIDRIVDLNVEERAEVMMMLQKVRNIVARSE